MSRATRSRPYEPRKLLTHRILVLSNTLGRGAVQLYARRFGIPLAEWRLLATLATTGPASVAGLAKALGTDKGWISRTAAALVEKKLAVTTADREDGRRFHLSLSAAGRSLYEKIAPAAIQRQRRLLAVLSDQEQRVLDDLLARLQREAERIADEEAVRSERRIALP